MIQRKNYRALRAELAAALRDAEGGKRLVVTRNEREVAALVPLEDLKRLEALDRRNKRRKTKRGEHHG